MSEVSTERQMIHVASLDDLRQQGCCVVHGSDRPIVVFYNGGDVRAVDNRCPHMGFPLHRGDCVDGIITCHWHHARFDAQSGCTFDLFADDVPAFDVQLQDDQVYVTSRPREHDPLEHGRQRLREGMQQNVALIVAKSILTLRAAKLSHDAITREIALFGVEHRDEWAMGLTVLTALANIHDQLSDETAYLALYQSARRVASDCAGQPMRVPLRPLETNDISNDTLGRWLNQWTTVRHRDGAERTLLTAIQQDATLPELNRLIFTAATQRYYAGGGHLVDFCNKALELLELIGPQHASQVLPTILNQLVSARGGEESNAWRHPLDLVPLIQQAEADLNHAAANRSDADWKNEQALGQALLGDDPQQILQAIIEATILGAKPHQLSQALAYAAAMRIARFGTANQMSDWVTALHTFSYCNALDQAIRRNPDPAILRGVLHGAMSVYLDRFLNIPPAKLPGERQSIDDLPRDGDELLGRFLDTLDQPQQVDHAARLVARYLSLGHDRSALIDTLVRAAVREDADFHTIQMVEAGNRQARAWSDTQPAHHILIAVARYLAAHSPTQRTQHQAARIALRLHRGENIYEEQDQTKGTTE